MAFDPERTQVYRRDVVGNGLRGALALATLSFLAGDATPQSAAESPNARFLRSLAEIQQLQNEIQRQYGIVTMSLDEMLNTPPNHLTEDSVYTATPWTQQDLHSLLRYLNADGFPPSFYAIDSRGPVRIALTSATDPTSQCCGGFEQNPNLRDVVVSAYWDREGGPILGYSTYIHELTHEESQLTDFTAIEDLGDGTTETVIGTQSPLFLTLTRVLGIPIADRYLNDEQSMFMFRGQVEEISKLNINEAMGQILTDRIGYTGGQFPDLAVLVKQLPLEIFEEYFFYDRFMYGLRNYSEFIAVAGQVYAYGPEYFLNMYGRVLGEDKAQALFEFMKKDVFKGWLPPWQDRPSFVTAV